MYTLPELYQLSMETEQPDDELATELFEHFSELRPDQQMHIAKHPVWQTLFQKRYGAIAHSVRAEFESCLTALRMEDCSIQAN